MNDALDPRKQATGKNSKVLNREVYYAGDTIIQQGDSGERAFYIESGKADVFVQEGKTRLKVAELGPGDIFGEMALITHEPRSATVIVKENCTIAAIDREDIEGKISRIQDKAIKALINVLVDRLKHSTHGQLVHYKHLTDFQDRVTGLVDRVHVRLEKDQKDQFKKDVAPLLADLQKVLDRYKQ